MKTRLYIIRGPIGVGKTTLTKVLQQQLLPTATTIIEPDLIKRMIDPTTSSKWRRDIAHASTVFMCELLLQSKRSVIVEQHSKHSQQLATLHALGKNLDAEIINILLVAPLNTCLARAKNRRVKGISYPIDERMVTSYYQNLTPQPGDILFDTSQQSIEQVANQIITLTK